MYIYSFKAIYQPASFFPQPHRCQAKCKLKPVHTGHPFFPSVAEACLNTARLWCLCWLHVTSGSGFGL